MDINHLRYIIAAADTLNFSRAAENLFITQPTLSHQIKQLELELGFDIFKRDTRTVTLTAAGEQFVEKARMVYDQYSELCSLASQLKESSSMELSCGASSLSSNLVSGPLSQFILQFPNISLSYEEGWDPSLIEKVLNNQLDAAIVMIAKDEHTSSKLRIYELMEQYVCAVLSKSHPLHKKSSIMLEELSSEKIIFSSNESGLTKQIKHEFQKRALQPDYSINSAFITSRINFLKSGAITFVMNKQFDIEYSAMPQKDDICVIPVEPKIYRSLVLVTKKSGTNRAVDLLVSALESEFQDQSM